VLFDVDIQTGTILQGTSNAHWYHLGVGGLRGPWLPPSGTVRHHPDVPVQVTDQLIPDMAGALKIVVE
ncbi:hypothetical protein B484DRAFT_406946, partial [Ochromonadaceae sp. CCMP2298]